MPRFSEERRELLVILDLNGTLLYRTSKATFKSRPKVAEFLRYLLTNHHVMVWSSAKLTNVDAMCKKLFNDEQLEQVMAIWGREKLHLEDYEFKSRVQVYKQLSWVWDDDEVNEAAESVGAKWDQENTVLIDDSVMKASSEPHNLLQIEEFTARPEQMTTDVLGQVVQYLETLSEQDDVSAYIHQKPFSYDADANPFDWDDVPMSNWRFKERQN